ncbi:MAG TPA: 30S ribosomal protein S8 [Myxococcota bacterium]|nr:30S ribosomal protein S8 [Myxococcota bacterium]
MVNDPIADFLTRIRNGLLARKREVLTNCSKMSHKIAEILERNGYIDAVRIEHDGSRKMMRIALRYDAQGKPVTEGLRRISKPGLRAYARAGDIPSVRGGMGLAIVSTSKGIVTGAEALKLNVGGEVLCLVW